jgi:hypothetical protein
VKFWDDERKQVIDRDGRRISIPFLIRPAQIARWTDAGYDVHAACDRNREFTPAWQAAADYKAASRMLMAFYETEMELALAQGVPADDPDIRLIATAPKAYMWEPATIPAA